METSKLWTQLLYLLKAVQQSLESLLLYRSLNTLSLSIIIELDHNWVCLVHTKFTMVTPARLVSVKL